MELISADFGKANVPPCTSPTHMHVNDCIFLRTWWMMAFLWVAMCSTDTSQRPSAATCSMAFVEYLLNCLQGEYGATMWLKIEIQHSLLYSGSWTWQISLVCHPYLAFHNSSFKYLLRLTLSLMYQAWNESIFLLCNYFRKKTSVKRENFKSFQ